VVVEVVVVVVVVVVGNNRLSNFRAPAAASVYQCGMYCEKNTITRNEWFFYMSLHSSGIHI